MVLAWLQYCGLYQGQIRLCFFLTAYHYYYCGGFSDYSPAWLYFCILHEQSADDTEATLTTLQTCFKANFMAFNKWPCLMHLKKVWWYSLIMPALQSSFTQVPSRKLI